MGIKKRFMPFLFLLPMLLPVPRPAYAEKVGVLFLHVGETEQYRCDSIQFQRNLFDILPPGFFAGSNVEGGSCYSVIHYADEAEAAICGVPEGTPVDIFCHEYTGSDTVHSITDHGFFGDRTFGQHCGEGLFPYVLELQDSTRDPVSGEDIAGPHVDDFDGPGIGIPEFLESYYFDEMRFMYRLPGKRNPQREQLLRWWYGNDAPGYAPLPTAQASIKDVLVRTVPGTEFVFRHGWEFYMLNEDVYGNPVFFADSTETALKELIKDEGVRRIIVFHSYPSFSNFSQFGHEWYDADGQGLSAVPGKTFTECVNDIRDGDGPKTVGQRDAYLSAKPWDKHADHPFPLIRRLVDELDPGVKLVFAPAYGDFTPFGEAVLAMIQHTVAKYTISQTAALKVLLVHHGFGAGYMNAQNCDCYSEKIEQVFAGVQKTIKNSFPWTGRFELAHAAGEFAEGSDDQASLVKPFGNVISQGEHIDMAINGRYVSETGMLVDNGLDNFNYIIVVPYFFDAESSDTLIGKRQCLGNNISTGSGSYARDVRDADGTDYNAEDYDEEYSTVKVYDGTGWPSRPKFGLKTVGKGSAVRPTTLILTGALLSAADDGKVQQHLTEAAVSAIEAALEELKEQDNGKQAN
jgi:hypothetical protein